jgi:hypothetical protein
LGLAASLILAWAAAHFNGTRLTRLLAHRLTPDCGEPCAGAKSGTG